MAERLSQYSMLSNFNPGFMQSQQQQGQPQQQQQQQQQEPPHLSMQNFPEQARMWQQIQHVNQLRPTGAEMNQQQSSAQVCFSLFALAPLARSTHLSTPPSLPGLSFYACGPLFSRLLDSMLLSLLAHAYLIVMPSIANRINLRCSILTYMLSDFPYVKRSSSSTN